MPTHTTTLKLPEELRRRVAPLAKRSGESAHAWMVAALEQQVTLAELREGFVAEALDSAREVDAGGPLYAAEDVHAYVLARAQGQAATRPAPMMAARR